MSQQQQQQERMSQQQQQQEPPLQRTGRGGAGNFRRPSTDPDNASTAKSMLKDIKDSASSIFNSKDSSGEKKIEYVHHGRGGAGNLSTTNDVVKPVQSVLDEKTPVTAKPVQGRGGAGNIRTASVERSSGEGRRVDVANAAPVVSTDAEKAGQGVQEPAQAHLGEGREVIHDAGN